MTTLHNNNLKLIFFQFCNLLFRNILVETYRKVKLLYRQIFFFDMLASPEFPNFLNLLHAILGKKKYNQIEYLYYFYGFQSFGNTFKKSPVAW